VGGGGQESGSSGKKIRGCHPSSASAAVIDARVSGTSAGWGAWCSTSGVAAFLAAASMSMTEWFLPVPTFRTVSHNLSVTL
jgi:hypothetical protein